MNSTPELPPKRLGKYEIRREVGRGGMGVVYEGFDPLIRRRVALKTLISELFRGPQAAIYLTRLQREAQAAGRLTHPNIVAVYDYGEESLQNTEYAGARVAFIAMEFVEGRELASYFNSAERFTSAQIMRIMSELLDALEYSHNRGVVHRDIKPSNIILLPDGTVKVADFGIARIESSTLTQTGTVMGSPSYMSPEQFLAQTVDGRSDLYSAAILLFELLTGEVPYSGSFSSIMHRVLNEEPCPPSVLNVHLPKSIDAILQRARAKRPADRYQTAAEFKLAIVAALAQNSPVAADLGRATRLRGHNGGSVPAAAQREKRRGMLFVLAVSAVVVVVAYLLGNSHWGQRSPSQTSLKQADPVQPRSAPPNTVAQSIPMPSTTTPSAAATDVDAQPVAAAPPATPAAAPAIKKMTAAQMRARADDYYFGRGNYRKDAVQAVKWYSKAADQGDAAAQAKLGALYGSGYDGIAQDDALAVKWLSKAANQGEADAQLSLGTMYQNGRGGLAKDDVQAVNWFTKAALQGNARAESNLGAKYAEGRGGLVKDETQALKWFSKAAAQGDAHGQNNLGVMYLEGRGGLSKDAAQAAMWYAKAAAQGDPHGQNNLGILYMRGRGGLPKDAAQAAIWFAKAAAQGDAHGESNLADLYLHGDGGLPKDAAQAAMWYAKAAAQGDSHAQNSLGLMYQYGRGALPQDDALAVGWYVKAAAQGDPGGETNLGTMYRVGRGGLVKDEAQAVQWFTKAASQGDAAAANNLGAMYATGSGGLPRDDARAVEWYVKAARQGSEAAQHNLRSRHLTW